MSFFFVIYFSSNLSFLLSVCIFTPETAKPLRRMLWRLFLNTRFVCFWQFINEGLTGKEMRTESNEYKHDLFFIDDLYLCWRQMTEPIIHNINMAISFQNKKNNHIIHIQQMDRSFVWMDVQRWQINRNTTSKTEAKRWHMFIIIIIIMYYIYVFNIDGHLKHIISIMTRKYVWVFKNFFKGQTYRKRLLDTYGLERWAKTQTKKKTHFVVRLLLGRVDTQILVIKKTLSI